ncbi:MAG TPA: hypothetical protein VLB86_03665, partial [Gaiellaceae bacterium]|nr:hypothetical protein [Gaiellaceae bacterium]
PVAAAAGPNLLDGMPAIVLLQVLVLLPAALVGVYALGARLAGRAVGLGAALLWVAGPWVAIPLFDADYHEKFVDQFLPQALGLTAMSDLPSTVALLAAALLTVRVLDHDDVWAGAAAGVGAGLALAIKPSVALALPAFALGLAVAGRWRAILGAFAGLALPVLALVVWKARGVGYLPAFTSGEAHVAAGGVFTPVEKYVDWSFDHLHQIERDLRGEFFSVRLLEVAPLVGIVGLARRTLPGAILVGGWFWLVVLVKGGSSLASIDSGSFFRYVMPVYPAFCVLVAALLLLVPTYGRRLAAVSRPGPPSRRTSIAVAAPLSLAFTAVLAVTALVTPVDRPVTVRWASTQPLIPVVDDLQPQASSDGKRVTLRWEDAPPTSAATFYRVFRGRDDDLDCSDDGGALYCTLLTQPVGQVREPVFSEEPPGPGRWIYRVSVAADYRDDPNEGDPVVISGPVAVSTS